LRKGVDLSDNNWLILWVVVVVTNGSLGWSDTACTTRWRRGLLANPGGRLNPHQKHEKERATLTHMEKLIHVIVLFIKF